MRGISLALSSGGARGLAHIGVLKVLDRHRIPIRAIAGSSMGGLVGALYCTGFTGEMIEEVILGLRRHHWIDFSFSKMGLVAGKKLEGLVSLLTRGRRFEDCQPPLTVVAVDIANGEVVHINRGDIARGVRATVSIPGVFSPVLWKNRLLVDGGVLNRIPVDVAGLVPNSPIVAVDAGIELNPKIRSVFDVMFQTFDIMAQKIAQYEAVDAEVVIRPQLGVREINFSRIADFIRAGEIACEQQIPKIMARLRKEGEANEEVPVG